MVNARTRLCTLFCITLVAALSAGHAAPSFTEVAAERKLNFIGLYGPTFDGLVVGAMMMRNMGNGAAVGDYDSDGDLDVFLLGQLGHANRLFRNDLVAGVTDFVEVTGPAGVDDYGLSRVAQFVDLDNDGHLDLLVVNDDDGSEDYSPSRVYRNNGDGTFSDVTATSGFRPLGYLHCGLALADYDQDGRVDIYVTNWGRELGSGDPTFPGSNRLYRNLGGFAFEDVTMAMHLDPLARDSFTAIFQDFEDDGYPDLFVALDHTTDEFFSNNDGNFFSRRTDEVGATHVGNDMGVACADIDDDGDLDLYATNITDPDFIFGTGQGNALHINQRDSTGSTSFVDEATARGVRDTYWGWGTEFTDVDNDGDLDIVAVTGFEEFITTQGVPGSTLLSTPAVLFLNDSNGQFSRAASVGLEMPDDSRGLIAFDYDRDGDEDLLVTNVDQPVRLYENQGTSQGHWLEVALVQQGGANRNGIGATVWATLGGVTKRRDVVAGDSFLAGGPTEIHLGLGSATSVDLLRVAWTDGTETSYSNVPADQFLQLEQPFIDDDLDGVHDGQDCDATDGDVWRPPAAVVDLRLGGGMQTTMDWSTPAEPGATAWSYDLLRATDPSMMGDASCLLTATQLTTAADASDPAALFCYLVRINNACGSTSGVDSRGRPRDLPSCP